MFHIPSIAAYILPTTLCLTGFKSPSAALHNEVSRKTSECQDEALRGVHTFLCTTHHPSPALFTPKVHWMIYGVLMTDLGWLPPVTSSGALASPAAEGTAFIGLYHATGNAHIYPLIWTHMQTQNAAMLFQLFYRVFLLMSHRYSPFPAPLSVSLYIFYITLSNTLPISLSINKSILGSFSRLNQPLCKHGC